MHITNYLSPTIDSVVSTLQATGSIIIISTFNSDLGEFIVVKHCNSLLPLSLDICIYFRFAANLDLDLD